MTASSPLEDKASLATSLADADANRQEWFDQYMTAYEKSLRGHRSLAEILKYDASQEREK